MDWRFRERPCTTNSTLDGEDGRVNENNLFRDKSSLFEVGGSCNRERAWAAQLSCPESRLCPTSRGSAVIPFLWHGTSYRRPYGHPHSDPTSKGWCNSPRSTPHTGLRRPFLRTF